MKKTFLALCSIAVLFYACKDEDVINNPDLTSTQATQDHLIAEQIFSDVGRIVEKGFNKYPNHKSDPNYILMNFDPLNSDTLIIDFGTSTVTNNNSIKSGKIIVTYTDRYRDSLSLITTTFDNYHVNYNLVQGERIVTNQGRNNKGNMWFTVLVNNASILTNSGIINWSSSRTREWVSGIATYGNITDDTYKITGSANGNGINSNSFSMEITDTLNIDLGCLPSCVIKSGTSKISPNGYADRIINYGDSLCDCNFDITINGTNYPIVVN